MKTDKQIADAIHDYWAARGHAVRTSVVSIGKDDHGVITGVRSNMVDGLPRSMKTGKLAAE